MSLTVALQNRFKAMNGIMSLVQITFDSSYPTNGEAITAQQLGLTVLKEMFFETKSGYLLEYDNAAGKIKVFTPIAAVAAHSHAVALDTGVSAAEAAHTHAAGAITGATGAGAAHTHAFTGTAITPENINVKDNDSAASDGVAVYLHTKDGRNGWFEFVSPTNADGLGTLNNGGSAFMIFDADGAATDGVAIYFDEDAAAADSRFLCVSPSGSDIFVPVAGSNQLIRIKHDASAASNGVQVYFDEDGTNSYERLMFVSPTNANGTGATDDTYVGMGIVPAGSNANESTHTHDQGTLAGAATGAGSSHTHGPGTLADAASGTGGAIAAAAAAEVANETNLSTLVVKAVAFGY